MTPDQVQKDLELVLEEMVLAIKDTQVVCPRDKDTLAAIARLRSVKLVAVEEGKHAYFSRFKPGDEMWVVGYSTDKEWRTWQDTGVDSLCFSRGDVYVSPEGVTAHCDDPGQLRCWQRERDCFPTREEAQAECDKRNKGTVDENGKVL